RRLTCAGDLQWTGRCPDARTPRFLVGKAPAGGLRGRSRRTDWAPSVRGAGVFAAALQPSPRLLDALNVVAGGDDHAASSPNPAPCDPPAGLRDGARRQEALVADCGRLRAPHALPAAARAREDVDARVRVEREADRVPAAAEVDADRRAREDPRLGAEAVEE